MREDVRTTLALYRANRLINSVMNDRARALFTQVALHLHFAPRPDGKSGLTISAMKDCLRRERALQPRPLRSHAAADARFRLLRGRRRTTTSGGGRWCRRRSCCRFSASAGQGTSSPCATCFPRRTTIWRLLDNPAFVANYGFEIGGGWLAGVRVLEHSEDLFVLTERSAGMILLYTLCAAVLAPTDRSRRPIPCRCRSMRWRRALRCRASTS